MSSKWTVTHVHNPAVDITELLEAKEPRTVCGVIEAVGLYVDNQYVFWGVELRIMRGRGAYSRGIDRHSSRLGGRIRFLT